MAAQWPRHPAQRLRRGGSFSSVTVALGRSQASAVWAHVILRGHDDHSPGDLRLLSHLLLTHILAWREPQNFLGTARIDPIYSNLLLFR